MKTVYVVTRGEYSDYAIEALFSTMEKANAYMDKFRLTGFNDVGKWIIDDDEGAWTDGKQQGPR